MADDVSGSVVPKRSGKIIAANPFITRNFISFKYRTEERARIEKNEMKDRKKLEKEMKKKEGSKVKNDSHVIKMPVVIEHNNHGHCHEEE